MRRSWIPALMTVALAAGCSGSKNFSGEGTSTGTSTGTTGTGTTGTTTTTTLSMGSGSGSSFQSGVIGIQSASLAAGGSTSLTVSIVDQTGALYTTATTITFNSTCTAQGLATIVATPASGATPASPQVSTSTGTATATYSATGCSGSDTITATASANGQSLSATGTVTVAAAAIGSIQFVSATPSQITLKGVGSSGGSSTSTVIFKVVDTSGGPSAGATVDFALNTEVGGITLTPTTAQSDASGEVQTIVSSGTQATTVRVTATTTTSSGTQISTQSNALTISTGIPTSANISLAVKCPNVEAWTVDGVTVPVTVSMTDRFSNPVPDGTTANFQTTLGGIDASCQTGAQTSGSGQCTVNWFSKAPRTVNGNPQTTTGSGYTDTTDYCTGSSTGPGGQPNLCNGTTNGRSPILVTAIGEESFKDATGSGVFNSTSDTVAWDATDLDNDYTSGANAGQPKPWFDTSEPFLNEWEIYDQYGTPTFFAGEPFIDFNNNGKRDGPDGYVESALCQGSLCAPTSIGDSVAIYAANVIILSGSQAYFDPSPTVQTYTLSGGVAATANIVISDVNNQQLPNGTSVTASIAPGTAGTVQSPTTYNWPCSAAVGGQTVSFLLSPPTDLTSFTPGDLIITVTTPGGIVTTARYPID